MVSPGTQTPAMSSRLHELGTGRRGRRRQGNLTDEQEGNSGGGEKGKVYAEGRDTHTGGAGSDGWG